MDQLTLMTDRGTDQPTGPVLQTLQRVMIDRAPELRPLYWRITRAATEGVGPIGATLADNRIVLITGTTLLFDTYFGAFFESNWRLHTSLRTLSLSVTVSGACIVRLRRRAMGTTSLLAESRSDGGTRTLRFQIPDNSMNFREYGMLYFEVTALDSEAAFEKAAWLGDDPTEPVALGIVFCTFNRESYIAAVLAAMVADPAVLARLDRVFVVNQGRPNLREHAQIAPLAARLGNRLTIIEQDNFGGAGGFTRGMLAVLDDPALTHCAFLDDDIRIEPDTVLRMIAFLSLAKDNVAVGGQMLDGVQQTRLYEGGAVIDSYDWFPRPVQHNTDLADASGLDVLTQPHPVHFNGWWCFAVSLDIVRRVGLPLPCFIRGDDAEYGMRLYRNGIPTIVLPGAAVWHEPFYLKLGNWQLYYETRNLLVLAALHDRFGASAALRRAGRRWLIHLLTFRYYGAALVMRGVADFLRGPEILKQNPRAVHAEIVALRTVYGPEPVGRRQVIERGTVARMPRHRIGFLFMLAIVLLRNALVRTNRTVPVLIDQQDFSWVGLRRIDSFVLDNWWEPEMQTYKRDRGKFWDLSCRTIPAMARLLLHGDKAATAWQQAAPELTSSAFWKDYLGCSKDDAASGARQWHRRDL